MNRRSFFNRLLVGAIAVQTKPEVLCPESIGMTGIVESSPSFEGVTEEPLTWNGIRFYTSPNIPERTIIFAQKGEGVGYIEKGRITGIGRTRP